MAFLSVFSAIAAVKIPNAIPWEALILNVFDFIAHYGWRIIIFTILLKLVLYPLDLYQRFKMRKNQKITQRLAPAIEKLQQQYGHDKAMFSRKQMELNRKEGYSYFSSCLPMIVSMVVFIWLFSSMSNVSRFMTFNQYYELYTEYRTVYNEVNPNGDADKEQQAIEAGQQAVYLHYYGSDGQEPLQTKFLWVKNIWAPDVPWQNKAIMDYKAFESAVSTYPTKKSGLGQEELNDMMDKAVYNKVMGKLLDDPTQSRVNGYLILPILAVLVSLASQFLTTRQQKKAGQINVSGGMATSMKIMMFAMPAIIAIISIQYSTFFALYMVTNSAMTVVLNLITSLLFKFLDLRDKNSGVNIATYQKSKKIAAGSDSKKNSQVIHYGRPDPNDLLKKKKDDK